MVKLSTQPVKPSTSKLIQLRSGFYSIPFKFNNSTNGGSTTCELFIMAKVYTGESSSSGVDKIGEDNGEWGGIEEEEDKEEEVEENKNKLFLTNLPLNSTEEILIKAFNKLFTGINKVLSVKLILPLNNSINSIKNQIFDSTTCNSNSIPIQPLFNSPLPTSSLNSPISAILTFQSLPSLTSSFPLISWPFPSSSSTSTPSYLKLSKQLYNLARPNLSTIIAHSDSWMSNLDRKKLNKALEIKKLSDSLSTKPLQPSKSSIKKSNNNNNKSKKSTTGPPQPGSAAYALSSHLSNVAKSKDRTINPDELIENDWTFVSRGGKHGKSLLPSDTIANSISGYGGINVKVSRRPKLGEEAMGVKGTGEEEVVKGIVGEGFYSFSKADSRRAGMFYFSFFVSSFSSFFLPFFSLPSSLSFSNLTTSFFLSISSFLPSKLSLNKIELTNLKAKFEEDKIRVSKFRESFSASSSRGSSSSRGTYPFSSRGRGGSGSSSRGSRGRGGTGSRGGSSGKGERSYKPY